MRSQRERLVRVAQEYTDYDPIITEAKWWLLDCFGHDEDAADYIADMSALDVILAVDQHYVGGWTHFVENSTCPFTEEEIEEAAAELDEEASEWVAYCTYCGAAVEADHDRRIVETVALLHASRNPGHQVIVGKEILGRSYGVCVAP